MRHMIYALFQDAGEAEAALQDIESAGLSKEQVHVAVHRGPLRDDDMSYAESDAFRGLLIGLLCGVVGGALIGLLLAGPLHILPLSWLTSIGLGILGGTVLGGLAGLLYGAGLPDNKLQRLHRQMHPGQVLLAVEAEDLRAKDAVVQICRQHGAIEAT